MTRAGRRAPSIGTEPPRSSSGRSAGNQPVFCRPTARDGSSSARRAFRRCLNWSARRHSISFNAGHHKAADELTLENEERYERWCNDEHSCGGQDEINDLQDHAVCRIVFPVWAAKADPMWDEQEHQYQNNIYEDEQPTFIVIFERVIGVCSS